MGQFIHKVLIKKTPDPLIGVACEPVYPLGSPHCTLRDSSSLKCRVCSQLHSAFVGFFYVSAISVCFWTPRLLLGHPGSFRSTHDLKCMRTQTGPRFNVPSERRGITTFSNTQSHGCTVPGPGIEPGPLP